MSPDDHYQNLKRIIAAVGGKARRINVIMPFLYESRQHKRSSRESLDCALAPVSYTHLVLDCDLLIIDDLGTEFANSFTTSQLFICLNERILRKKSTLISTNLALEDIRNIYSERIFSRITSTYTVLRMTGDDIRIQKKLMNKY